MARLTLCTIARDEERMLPDCLRSVAGVVDEIVVADTGSADRTVAIAEAAGAVVVRHVWADDFSAARNAALAAATGDWVLVLDADERLARGAGAALRRAMASGIDAALLPLHEADAVDAPEAQVLDGRRRLSAPVWLPRLFRRDPALRWEGVVHEHVATWLEAPGRVVRTVQAPIVHLGAVPALRAAGRKDERNARLLARRVALDPSDVAGWSLLTVERVRMDDGAGAVEAAERGWAALEAQVSEGRRPRPFATLAAWRARLQLARDDVRGALETLETALRWGADHPDVHLTTGRCHELLGGPEHLALAAAAYRRALALDGRTLIEPAQEGGTSWLASLRLGVALVRAGEARLAQKHLEAAGDRPEAAVARAEAALALGDPERALEIVTPALDPEGRPDAWVVAADAADAAGDPEAVAVLLDTARALPRGFLEHHRAILARELDAARALYEGRPAPGVLGALVGRRPYAGSTAPPPRLQSTLANLLRLGRTDAIEALLEPRAEALLGGAVHAALAALGVEVSDDGEQAVVFVGGARGSGAERLCALLDVHPRLTVVREADEAARPASGLRPCDASPDNLLSMRALAQALPRARFVHVLRDGRAVVAERAREGAPIATAARDWASAVQRIREQAVPGRYLEVDHEDLLADPAEALRRVLAFLGEPDDGLALPQGQPIGALRALDASAIAAIDREAGALLAELGYDAAAG